MQSSEQFAALAAKSQVLHGNKHVLPVALAVRETGGGVCSVRDILAILGAYIPPHRVHEALRRLCEIGALAELPYAGRPHPRIFERRADPYWGYVEAVSAAYAADTFGPAEL